MWKGPSDDSIGGPGGHDRTLSRIQRQWTVCLCACPSIVANTYLVGAKSLRLSDHTTERPGLCTRPRLSAGQIPAYSSDRMEISSIMIWSIWSAQRRWGPMIFMKIIVCQTLATSRIWPWAIWEPLTRGIICQGYPLFNAPIVPASRMLVMMSWIWDTTLSTGLERVYSTAKAFEDAGITPVGVYAWKRPGPLGDQGRWMASRLLFPQPTLMGLMNDPYSRG